MHTPGGVPWPAPKGTVITENPPSHTRSAVTARLRAAGCVFAEDEARLLVGAARSAAHLAELVERRAAGEPLEQLLGWARFCGLRVAVAPGVFVPRRRTEFLVRRAIGLATARTAPGTAVVVDLCCGCGAVGAALAAALPGCELHAVDIDPAAVRCARRNLAEAGGPGPGGTAIAATVYQGDLYQPLPAALRGRVGILVANAPYVPTAALDLLPPEARLHEPRTALDGGPDGLDILRRVAADARHWLAPGGHLLAETGHDQAAAAAAAMASGGLSPRVAHSRALGATVVIATRPRGRRGEHRRRHASAVLGEPGDPAPLPRGLDGPRPVVAAGPFDGVRGGVAGEDGHAGEHGAGAPGAAGAGHLDAFPGAGTLVGTPDRGGRGRAVAGDAEIWPVDPVRRPAGTPCRPARAPQPRRHEPPPPPARCVRGVAEVEPVAGRRPRRQGPAEPAAAQDGAVRQADRAAEPAGHGALTPASTPRP